MGRGEGVGGGEKERKVGVRSCVWLLHDARYKEKECKRRGEKWE